MSTSVVGITFFYNLKTSTDVSTSVRPPEFYQKNCITTLSVKIPLVIFCDKSSREWIEPLRSSLSTAQTVYVEHNFFESDFYTTNLPIINENRKNYSHVYNSENRNTSSYFLLTMFKIHAIYIGSRVIPNATHYAWIDFGCQHVVWKADEYLDLVLKTPKPKLAFTYIHYRNHNELADMKKYLANGGYCGIAAGFFTVEKSYVSLFFTRCMSIFYEMLSNGVGHSEEQVFTYLFDRFPDMFSLVYGDYYSLVSNYNFIVRDVDSIIHFFINNAIADKKYHLAIDAAQKILESYELNKITINQNQFSQLYNIISTYS
jgi:hypothetical protein